MISTTLHLQDDDDFTTPKVTIHHHDQLGTWASFNLLGLPVCTPDDILEAAYYFKALGDAIRGAYYADLKAQEPQLGLGEVEEDAADDCGTQPLTDDPRHDAVPAETWTGGF